MNLAPGHYTIVCIDNR